jgi:hypothetical protein
VKLVVRTSNVRQNYVSFFAASKTTKPRNAQLMERIRQPIPKVTKRHY